MTTRKQITIHTVEVVTREPDGNLIPGSFWMIVSAEPVADIERRFERQYGSILGAGQYFTAHRVPGTDTLIDEEA